MLVLKKIAITGGLGCGKTTVCRTLRKLNAYVVNADEIVHQLLSPNTNIGRQVVNLIGQDIVIEGTINRQTIAKRVFNQPKLLRSLEQILHPAVKTEIERQYQIACKEGNTSLFVAEVPLLFESHMEPFFDAVIVVIADPEKCKERSGLTLDDYERRVTQQMSQKEKVKRADYIVENNNSFEETEKQIKQIFNQLTK